MLSKIGSVFKRLLDYLLGHTSKEVVERNERLFQTYLIVFGLLISCNFEDQLKEQIMMSFMIFIWAGLFYYVTLSRFYKKIPRISFNVFALSIGFTFSYGIVPCVFVFSPTHHGINPFSGELITPYLILTILVSTSLFV